MKLSLRQKEKIVTPFVVSFLWYFYFHAEAI